MSAAARKEPVRSREGPGRSVAIHSPKRERRALTRSSPHVLATMDVSVGVMSTPCPCVRTTNSFRRRLVTATAPVTTSVEVWAFVTSIAHFVPRTAAIASGVRI